MGNASTSLRRIGVGLRRAARVTSRRLTGNLPPGRLPDVTDAEFRQGIETVLSEARADLLREHRLFTIPGNRPPWFDTGIDLEAGETLTWLAAGRVYLSKLLDIFVEPHFQLWARIGDGPIFKSTRATNTFTAGKSGRLYFASYFPGQWGDASGNLETDEGEYKSIEGGVSVALLRWRGDDAQAGLKELAKNGEAFGLLAMETDRLANPVGKPDEWNYLWFLGDSEIYTHTPGVSNMEGNVQAEIHCCTHCDVGILQYDADMPLEPSTKLSWSWKIDALPSEFAEDILLTHDYLSIAVEFDNGIDVTYYWSAELPVDMGYWCPLPTWKDREFHVVQRSGKADLGQWLSEERYLYQDYERYIGTPPGRIKRVWFIANSLFQRIEGRCAYREIVIEGGSETKTVL